MDELETAGALSPDFNTLFGDVAPAVVAEAPGRVNLIGEHTDYNGGYVLPMILPYRTRAEASLRRDNNVWAWTSAAEAGRPYLEYLLGEEEAGEGWLDYVQGLTSVLRKEGHKITGFNLRVTSDVPVGSGLSSSAALEVAVLRSLRELFGLPLDDLRLALVAHRAENEFVGANVGVMDQMVSSLGKSDSALFIDTRTLRSESIPLPPGAEIAVINSGVVHRHADGGYNARRRECEEAARLLGVGLLSDLSAEKDLARISRLPAPLSRRARHVVTENRRVLEAVEALKRADWFEIGRLFEASHASMRDDYEVSTPEIDFIVGAASEEDAVIGARLTGGGFGGSVVLLTHPGRGRECAARIAEKTAGRFGCPAVVLLPKKKEIAR